MGFMKLGRLLTLGRSLMKRRVRRRYSLPENDRFVPRVNAFEQHPLDGEFLRDLRVKGGDLESRTSKTARKN